MDIWMPEDAFEETARPMGHCYASVHPLETFLADCSAVLATSAMRATSQRQSLTGRANRISGAG